MEKGEPLAEPEAGGGAICRRKEGRRQPRANPHPPQAQPPPARASGEGPGAPARSAQSRAVPSSCHATGHQSPSVSLRKAQSPGVPGGTADPSPHFQKSEWPDPGSQASGVSAVFPTLRNKCVPCRRPLCPEPSRQRDKARAGPGWGCTEKELSRTPAPACLLWLCCFHIKPNSRTSLCH